MGWEWKKLKDFAKVGYGYTAKADYNIEGPKYLRITDIQNDDVDWSQAPSCNISTEKVGKYQLKIGDIVFARTGATTGKSYLIKDPPFSVFASYLIRVQANQKSIYPEYLAYYFQSYDYWQVIEKGTSGSAQGGFNATKLKELQIPVPPLPEQHRLVALLDAAFAKLARVRAGLERGLGLAEELFESSLTSAIGNLIEQYGTTSLENVCDLQNGFAFKSKTFKSTGTRIVRIKNIKNGTIKMSKSARIDKSDYENLLDRYLIHKGDILIAMSGATTGKIGIYSEDEPSLLNQRVGKFEPKSTISSDFLYLYLTTMVERSLEMSYGSAQPNLSTKQIKEFKLPVPSIEKQNKFSKELNQIRERIAVAKTHYQTQLTHLAELKQSLLARAFAGEL